LAIGSDVQAYDAQLADIAGMTPTDNHFIVGDGANFVLETGAVVRTSLGLGSAALAASGDFLAVANNLSDLAAAGTARTNLGVAIGSDVQAYDVDLDTLSGMESGAPAALALLTSTEIAILDDLTSTTAQLNSLNSFASASYGADSRVIFKDSADKIKIVTQADFLGQLVGSGLSVGTSGGDANKLVVDGKAAPRVLTDADAAARTCQEGVNFVTGTAGFGAAKVVLPGTATSSPGDVVTVKVTSTVTNPITITGSGAQRIDGESQIVLESAGAAVSMVYLGPSGGFQHWGII
jgi:hypothetical protein